jgi:WxcM-like, C-terminal
MKLCKDQAKFVLGRGDRALRVPPNIWTIVTCRKTESILVVPYDRPYEPGDCISEYTDFLQFRAESG